MLRIAILVHRNILSCQCYIRYVDDDNNSVDKLKVSCFPYKLNLALFQNNGSARNIRISAPSDVFLPSSLFTDSATSVEPGPTLVCRVRPTSSGQSVGELSFRLQVSCKNKIDCSDIKAPVDVKEFFRIRFQEHSVWNAHCGNCDHPLAIGSVSFDGVKEYSDSELSEGWFCHGSAPQDSPQPSSRILFVDNLSFYLQPSLLFNKTESSSLFDGKCDVSHSSESSSNSDSTCSNMGINICPEVKHSTAKAFDCPSCGDRLTTDKAPSPFVRFYFDKLMFRNPALSENTAQYALNVAMLSFWSLVQESLTSSLMSKIFLQSKGNEEDVCLLLWIPSEKIAQFLLEESVGNLPSEAQLKTEAVYKVLYFIGTSSSDNVLSWRHDFSVDYYCVSDALVSTVIEILKKSSEYIFEAETSKGFNHGCLPVYSGCS